MPQKELLIGADGRLNNMKQQIIVYCYIVGDILHKGHIEHLKNCKALGDKLIVGVLTDAATQEKKPKPTMNFDERVDLVRALKMTDIVVAQDKYSPIRNIAHIQPDILVESVDHKHINDKYLKFIRDMGIRLVVLPYYPNHSSTAIKNKIKEKKE